MLLSHVGTNSDAISDETINISHRLERLYDAIETGKIDLDELRNLFNNSSLVERKAFIQSFVKEVKVTGDEVLLTYTVPLSPRRVPEEKAGVLSTVQYSGPYGTVPELSFGKKELIPRLQQLLIS